MGRPYTRSNLVLVIILDVTIANQDWPNVKASKGCSLHSGKTNDWPMMSRPTDVLNEPFVCYQDLSEYVGRENIERGFPGEPALKRITKPKFQILPQLYGAATPKQLDGASSYEISTRKHFSKSWRTSKFLHWLKPTLYAW